MEQEKFGNLIKEIRKKNNLTQKDLADKYHVTYQAVSKWERGLNLPDIALMKEIARDFNYSIDEMISGNLVKRKSKKIMIFSFIGLFLLVGIVLFFVFRSDDELHSRPIKASCDDFNIYGIISYNEKKSAIYIPKIEYCGNDNKMLFKEINCTLYEKYQDGNRIISSEKYNGNKSITLEEFLKNVSFHVDNYLQKCFSYQDDSLYLEIKGSTEKTNVFYTIPLSVEADSCHTQPEV